MNFIDKAIGYVSPQAGLKRAKARMALEKRGYAGAALGRGTDGWFSPSTSADAEVFAGGRRLRDRMRDLTRNNPYASQILSKWVSNIVGDGIRPRCDDKKAQAAFDRWSLECDADGQLDFFGLQALAVREMIEGGEVLARRRPRRGNDGLIAPVQVQLLEADHIDSNRASQGGAAPGNQIVQGIEFDQIGRRAAYWLFPQHPGNTIFNFGDNPGGSMSPLVSRQVPATEIAHLYEKQRTQVRGVPWFHPVIRKMRDVDDWEYAEIVRKKIESAYVGAVLCDDENEMGVTASAQDSKAAGVTDAQGNILEQFEPGVFAFLRGAKDIKFNAPASIGGYGEYKVAALREIAAGCRMPYEVASGDLSGTNFSSIRAGLLDFRRLVTMMQSQLVIPMYCRPIWRWFCEAAFLAGEISSPDVPVRWDSPKFEWVDPYKEALADLIAMRAGTRTLPEIAAERGRSIEEVLDEIAATNIQLDARGIILDSDPRKVSKVGVAQPTDNPADNQGGGAVGQPNEN